MYIFIEINQAKYVSYVKTYTTQLISFDNTRKTDSETRN